MSEVSYSIVTGVYHPEDDGQRQAISAFFGQKDTEELFRLYFHWYNVIHELGHYMLRFPPCAQFSQWEEERIVNDFAVAYRARYGAPDAVERFRALVLEAHERFSSPAADGENPMEYARRVWGTAELLSFNNYGWFQFSLVRDSLEREPSLADALAAMGIPAYDPGTARATRDDLSDPALALQVLRDAREALRDWGIDLPELPHILSGDPNRHCLSTAGY